MKCFNLNDHIKVKLTDYGKDIFYHQFDALNKFITASGGEPIKPQFPTVDDDGFTEFQLWEFMHIYGPIFTLGNNKMPINPLNIFVEEKDLH